MDGVALFLTSLLLRSGGKLWLCPVIAVPSGAVVMNPNHPTNVDGQMPIDPIVIRFQPAFPGAGRPTVFGGGSFNSAQ